MHPQTVYKGGSTEYEIFNAYNYNLVSKTEKKNYTNDCVVFSVETVSISPIEKRLERNDNYSTKGML